ncbi:MAG: RNase adaptor protein RapZ, partial [Deltaproteobacteria bacterium]|nr:RNase adaptor protein RapZ [Deltaproteobacteria bacterium]
MSEPGRSDSSPLKIVLISGMSGAGKTLALKALEDLQYFAIDNLPCRLVDPLVLLLEQNREIGKVALVMDGRDPAFPQSAEAVVAGLRGRGHQVTLIFLEASQDVLIRRFAETRRPHPMARGASVEKGVQRESEMLSSIKRLASQVLDTTDFNVHRFRAAIVALVEKDPGQSLGLVIASFGFP